MLTVSSDILSLSAEAAVLVRAGRVVYANHAAEALLGSGCVGKTVAALFGREIAEAQSRAFTAELTLSQRRCVLRTAEADETRVLFFSPIEDSPALLSEAFVCSLRGSLMNCRLSCDLMRERAERYADDELDANLASVQRAAFRITRLLDNADVLRSAAMLELVPASEAIELSAFCRYLLDGVAALAPGIRFTLHADGELWLLGDRTLLRQMILNLLSNCLVHAAPLQTVTLSLLATASRVILSVSDDGCGIPEEKMSRVFDRYRAPFTLEEMGRGAGLGLSVVRSIARVHGGTLLLESRPSVGTSARVSLARRLPAKSLRDAEPLPTGGVQPLLIALSDCLTPDCFRTRYMD